MDLVFKILASLGGVSFVASGIFVWIGKVGDAANLLI